MTTVHTMIVPVRPSVATLRRRAFTLLEIVVAMVLSVAVIGLAYKVFDFFLGRSRASSVTTMMGRTFAQQDIRIALQKLDMRIKEGTEILEPKPGETAPTLLFRDLLNRPIRLRLNETTGILLSERYEDGVTKTEIAPTHVETAGGVKVIVTRPIRIPHCTNAAFTVVSPSCVIASLTLRNGPSEDSIVTALRLRNFNLAVRGDQ